MQLHELRPKHKLKKKKRIGRGGKRGTYCGRGVKGQSSRAGRKFVPIIRSLIKRYPKLRGYRFKHRGTKPVIINIETLEKNFPAQTIINPEILLKQGLIRRIKGKVPQVKILGKGKVTKSFILENCLVSKQAKEKIEGANGHIQ